MESKTLLEEVQVLTSELLELQAQFQELEQRNGEALSSLSNQCEGINSQLNSVHSIDEIEGRRSPKWYVVEIPFEYGESKSQSNTIEIETEPFICTQVQCSYLITDTNPEHFPYSQPSKKIYSNANPAGRSLPCTSYFTTCATMRYQYSTLLDIGYYAFSPTSTDFFTLGEVFSSFTDVSGAVARGFGWNYPEFDFEISIVGSGRHWTSGKLPAPALFGGSNPLYLGTHGFIDGADRLQVIAHPTIPTINTKGIVRVTFFGYEIETTSIISDILGY